MVKKITTYELDDGSDVSFIPSAACAGRFEVWVNGIFIETMENGVRPNQIRAEFYHETQVPEIRKRLGLDEPSTLDLAS